MLVVPNKPFALITVEQVSIDTVEQARNRNPKPKTNNGNNLDHNLLETIERPV